MKDLLPSQWAGKPVIEGVVDAYDTSATRLSDTVAQRVLESQIDTASADQVEEYRQLLGAPRVDFRSFSRAALFPSAVLSVSYGNQTTLKVSGSSLTVQARIRVDDLPAAGSSVQGIVSKWGTLVSQQSFRLALVRDSGVWYLDARVIDGAANVTASRVAFDTELVGQWARVAFRFDGTEALAADRLVIFIDGAEVVSTSLSSDATALQDANEPLYVGEHDGGGAFQGAIDMAIVWAALRTDGEIAELGDPAEGSGAGYWTFTPTKLSKTADLSGNGQDLEIAGTLQLTDGPQATLVWARRLIRAFAAAARCPGSIEAMYRAWRHGTSALSLDATIDTPFTAGEITWNHDAIPREGDLFVDQEHEAALLAAVQAAAPSGAVVTAVEI